MDVSDGNTYFEWKVNRHWMQRWKAAEFMQAFWSPTFNAIGAKWKLRIYPNGWDLKGHAKLHIFCQSIASGEKEIDFSHFVQIESMNYCQTHFEGNSIRHSNVVTCSSPFKWNDILNESEMTICVKIWKTGSIETDGARLVASIYSDKMKKLRIHMQQEKDHTIGKLKTQMASLKREKETIAMRDQNNAQEIVKLRKETEHLRNSVGKLAMREIRTFDVIQEVVVGKDIIEKQKTFHDQMILDDKRLNEWRTDSQKIQNELKSEQKETETTKETSQQLLNRFIEYKRLCEKQQMRMENVVMHCTKLNQIKKTLKNERKRCTEMLQKLDKDCQDLSAKHQTLQTKRSEIQRQWRDSLEAMNKCIDEENKTNDAKSCAQNQYNINDLEAQQWN
eukprot:704397_1